MNKQHLIASLGISGLIFATLLSSSAQASHISHHANNSYTDQARVIQVDPIVRYVNVSTPEKSCWKERLTHTRYDNNNTVGQTILGGIIGAAIGNNIGHGRGRKSRAIAGAIIGSTVANHNASRGTRSYQDVRYEDRCEVSHVSHTEERIDGYNVTYKYRGQRYTTRMPYRPGKHISVRVKVEPVFDN